MLCIIRTAYITPKLGEFRESRCQRRAGTKAGKSSLCHWVSFSIKQREFPFLWYVEVQGTIWILQTEGSISNCQLRLLCINKNWCDILARIPMFRITKHAKICPLKNIICCSSGYDWMRKARKLENENKKKSVRQFSVFGASRSYNGSCLTYEIEWEGRRRSGLNWT